MRTAKLTSARPSLLAPRPLAPATVFKAPTRPLSLTPRRRVTSMGMLLSLGTAIGVPLGLGQLAGLISLPDVVKWYPKLKKPWWTPPVILFGPIWAVLYTAMGLASHRVWLAGAQPFVWAMYCVQLLLNLAWQPIFFKTKNLKAASIDITGT
jgi:tryptophan-rich sensory protein